MHALVRAAILTVSFCGVALHAQDIRVEKIDLTIKEAKDLRVIAEVKIPKTEGRPALVLVLLTAGGIDGTGAQYIQALNARGIATAELNLLADEDLIRNVMMSKIVMGHSIRSYGIDPARVGIMGFSHGAMASLIANSAPVMDRMAPLVRARFKAHAALYPVCSLVYDMNREPYMNWYTMLPKKSGEPNPYQGMFNRTTGGKVLLLAAQEEDYEDAPTACPKIIEEMNASAPGAAELVIYPDATHGWDTTRTRNYEHAVSRKNRQIRHYRSQATYEKSLAAVTDFFVRELAPRQ